MQRYVRNLNQLNEHKLDQARAILSELAKFDLHDDVRLVWDSSLDEVFLEGADHNYYLNDDDKLCIYRTCEGRFDGFLDPLNYTLWGYKSVTSDQMVSLKKSLYVAYKLFSKVWCIDNTEKPIKCDQIMDCVSYEQVAEDTNSSVEQVALAAKIIDNNANRILFDPTPSYEVYESIDNELDDNSDVLPVYKALELIKELVDTAYYNITSKCYYKVAQ